MSDTLVVNEIYLSLQGESTFAGLPCVFVRLTACNLRCSYCDTAYAFTEGKKKSLEEVRSEVKRLAQPYMHSKFQIPNSKLPLVELTGGEPLLQKNSLPLMKQLCDDGLTVLLETSGALDISPVDPRVRRIMDLKCPSSGEVERNRIENITHLKATDEMSCAPLVSSNTVKPLSQSRFISGREFFWSNGSPPVSSTKGTELRVEPSPLRFAAPRG